MNNKLRVLAICHEDPAWILGGMGMHVRELYRAMTTRDDVEIDLLTSGPGEGTEEYFGYRRHLSDKLVCKKPIGPNMNAYRLADFQLAKTLTRLLAQGQRWDVVHIHEWNSVELGRMARDAMSIPMVGTLHLCLTRLAGHEDCPTDNNHPLTEELLYMFQQEAHLVVDTDRFIACSGAYKKICQDTFLTDRPVEVIYNGIRSEEWNPNVGSANRGRANHNLPPRPIALYVGRIADMKGIRPLLTALESKDPGYCCVLAGEVNADTKEQIEAWDVTKRIRALEKDHPERLRWVRFQHGEALKDLYAAAAVGLVPSIHEPFGIVALEHLAMGVPLICTEVDGLGEIVVNNAGEEFALIIDPGQPGQILSALEMLKDKDKCEELRAAGLRRVLDFDWFHIAEQTVDVYRQAVGENNADRT